MMPRWFFLCACGRHLNSRRHPFGSPLEEEYPLDVAEVVRLLNSHEFSYGHLILCGRRSLSNCQRLVARYPAHSSGIYQ